MKKLTILVVLSMISCNGQQGKKETIESKTKAELIKKIPSKNLDLTNLKFNTNINEVLNSIGLTLNDNNLNEYNMSGDYEEFQFSSQNIDLFNTGIDSANSKLSFFYTKKDNLLWCYELEILDDDLAKKVIGGFENSYGKVPAFSKISSSTKEHPIFLDENGEPEKDHMEERILVWEDIKNKITFFVIYKVNYDKKPIDGNLQVIALNKNSKKYGEWVSYRSLDMYYKH